MTEWLIENSVSIVALVAAILAFISSRKANLLAEKTLSLNAEIEVLKVKESREREARSHLGSFLSYVNVMNYNEESRDKAIYHYNQLVVLLNSKNPNSKMLMDGMVKMISRSPDKPYSLKSFDNLWSDYFTHEWDLMVSKIEKKYAKNK